MIHKLCNEEFDESRLEGHFQALRLQLGEERLQIVVNQRNDLRYTPLHTAIFSRNLSAIRKLISSGANVDVKCHGTPPLHLTLRTCPQPEGREFGQAAFLLLLEQDVNILQKDDNGFTVMHLASMFDLAHCMASILLKDSASKLVNMAVKHSNITPLHLAAHYDAHHAAAFLIQHGAKIGAKLALCGSTPLHLAACSKAKNVWSLLVAAGADAFQTPDAYNRSAHDILELDSYSLDEGNHISAKQEQQRPGTGIFTSHYCLQHHTCPPSKLLSSSAPPENVRRLHVLFHDLHGILRSQPLQRLQWFIGTHTAPITDILRVHEWSYVQQVKAKCAGIQCGANDEGGLVHLDGDTAISSKSYLAALAAAGSVCEAVDGVISGTVQNAFCPVRPPGHHSGPRGVVRSGNNSDSHGFCLFNNVSIGAAYAMNRYRDVIKKVAIVDFDVHHGNGTEETIRMLSPVLEQKDYVYDFCFGSMYAPLYKPWFGESDRENVLFVSVHGYGPRERGLEHLFPLAAFYPGTGATKLPEIRVPEVDHGEEDLSAQELRKWTEDYQHNRPLGDVSPLLGAEDGAAAAPDGRQGEDADADCAPAKKGSEDSEDDESYVEGEEPSDDDDEEEENRDASHVAAADALPRGQIEAMKSTFADKQSAQPLIVDIGAHLPEYDDADAHGLQKQWMEYEYRLRWRNYFRDEIFPRLLRFSADMIFISAGFDAHRKDLINAGYIALVEEDFAWLTSQLVAIANVGAQGRVVSVLEGGYAIHGEHCSAFAKSVFAHVFTLHRSHAHREMFDPQKSAIEKAREYAILARMKQQWEEEMAKQSAQGHALNESLLAMESAPTGAASSEEHSRKRRREPIDYVALDAKLREVGSGV